MSSYIPERGDVVWLDFEPSRGHEQAKRRPAVTLSPKLYNRKTRLALFSPVTSHIKGYPFEVVLPEGLPVTGVIITDQMRTMDWDARKAVYICSLPKACILEMLQKARTLLD